MSWDPDDSTLAWARGPWAFRRARLVCAVLGHRWQTSREAYGPGEHLDVIPWDGVCDRCGLVRDEWPEDADGCPVCPRSSSQPKPEGQP